MNHLDQQVMCFNGQGDTHKYSLTPYDTISLRLVWAMAKTPDSKPKSQALALMASSYCGADGRAHEVQREHGQFVLLRIDIDTGNKALVDIKAALMAFAGDGVAMAIYSTSSASPTVRKWRGLIALHEPVSYAVWHRLQRALHLHLTKHGIQFDGSMERAGQYMVAPNKTSDFWQYHVSDGHALDANGAGVTKALVELDAADLLVEQAAIEARTRSAERKTQRGSTNTQGGLIEAYNAANPLSACFSQYGFDSKNGIDWHHPMQTSDSYSWRDFGDCWVCVSASADDNGIGAVSSNGMRFGDAFDLFTHFEHGGKQPAAFKAAAKTVMVTDADSGEKLTWHDWTKREWVKAQQRGKVPAADFTDAPAADQSPFPDIDAWPELQPLVEKIEPQAYPLEALPPLIRGAVMEVCGFVKAPVPLVAMSALAALSVAIQAHTDVQRAEKLEGSCGLFLLAIADSGERKTSCDGYFTKAIRDYEQRQREHFKPILKECATALEAWDAKRSGVREKLKALAKDGKPTTALEKQLHDLDHEKPLTPRVPRLLYSDATPEALALNLVMGWPSGGVFSNEAGAVLGGHGMNKDTAMRNMARLNQLWDGRIGATDRATTQSYGDTVARLTVSLQVQEPTLRAFFDSTKWLARGTGFLARFLVAWPESTMGTRMFEEPPSNWPALAAFNNRLTAILDRQAPVDDFGVLTPGMLTLSPDAKQAWVTFHDSVETMLGTGGELFDLRDVASKAADNVARLAALFHVFGGNIGTIDLECLESAAQVVTWHLLESKRFLGELAMPPELANPMRLETWAIDWCRREATDKVPTREVQRFAPSGLRDKAVITATTQELAELGRARLVSDGKKRLIQIRPELLQVTQ